MGFWTGQKVLITGGAGFIGSYLTEKLVAYGSEVTVVDDLSRGKFVNLKTVRDDINFLQYDLRNPDLSDKACTDQDIVLHLASRVGGMYYNMNNHTRMFIDTMALSCNVVDSCIKKGVSLLYEQSTACVNDHDCPVPTPEEVGHDGLPEATNEGYGWAKRMGERLGGWAAKEYGIKVAIGRPWNAYGPERDYDDEETSHVIPALLKRIYTENGPLLVYGHGNQERVFIYVDDLIDAILLTTERYAECDPVNLGVPESIKIKDLAQKLLNLTGYSDKGLVFDNTKEVGYERRAAVNTKLREVIGWEQKVLLDDGLRRVVDWYSENRAPTLRMMKKQRELDGSL